MVQFMNAFYALDDIKRRTKKFYQKLDAIQHPFLVQEDDPQPSAQSESQLFDDNFIFRHFYQNKILLIKQHKKEEREEKEAYAEALL